MGLLPLPYDVVLTNYVRSKFGDDLLEASRHRAEHAQMDYVIIRRGTDEWVEPIEDDILESVTSQEDSQRLIQGYVVSAAGKLLRHLGLLKEPS